MLDHFTCFMTTDLNFPGLSRFYWSENFIWKDWRKLQVPDWKLTRFCYNFLSLLQIDWQGVKKNLAMDSPVWLMIDTFYILPQDQFLSDRRFHCCTRKRMNSWTKIQSNECGLIKLPTLCDWGKKYRVKFRWFQFCMHHFVFNLSHEAINLSGISGYCLDSG